MKSKLFHFKKFSVSDDQCAMKVGTDAVLLGAWVSVNGAERILDVGTGSGVIALILAQRSRDDTIIDAIEIEKKDANQARENVLGSPWPNKVVVHHTSLQSFNPRIQYDLIVSNPPYFVNSLVPTSPSRKIARHTCHLTFEELIDYSSARLNPTGRLAVILPFTEGNSFKSLAAAKHLHLTRETAFHSRKEKPIERWLLEFSKSREKTDSSYLVLYDSDGNKTEAYRDLTDSLYL